MNRKKTAGLLVAAMGLSLALTGCGETTAEVTAEVENNLPEEFYAYGENGDLESTITIDDVTYYSRESDHFRENCWFLYLCQ